MYRDDEGRDWGNYNIRTLGINKTILKKYKNKTLKIDTARTIKSPRIEATTEESGLLPCLEPCHVEEAPSRMNECGFGFDLDDYTVESASCSEELHSFEGDMYSCEDEYAITEDVSEGPVVSADSRGIVLVGTAGVLLAPASASDTKVLLEASSGPEESQNVVPCYKNKEKEKEKEKPMVLPKVGFSIKENCKVLGNAEDLKVGSKEGFKVFTGRLESVPEGLGVALEERYLHDYNHEGGMEYLLGDWMKLNDYSSLEELREYRLKGEEKLRNFGKILSVQGFASGSDILNDGLYASFLEVISRYSNLNDYVRSMNHLRASERVKLYKWSKERYMLEFYVCVMLLMRILKRRSLELGNSAKMGNMGSEDALDLVRRELEELRNLEFNLSSTMDTSLVGALRKGGISLTISKYLGLDTEYQNIEIGENKLLSVQLSQNVKSSLRLPCRRKAYSYSRKGALDSKIVLTSDYVDVIDNKKVLADMNVLISYHRENAYPGYDKLMDALALGLSKMNYSNIETEKSRIFVLGHTGLKQWMRIVRGRPVSLKELLSVSEGLARDSVEKSYESLVALLPMACSIGEEGDYGDMNNNFKDYLREILPNIMRKEGEAIIEDEMEISSSSSSEESPDLPEREWDGDGPKDLLIKEDQLSIHGYGELSNIKGICNSEGDLTPEFDKLAEEAEFLSGVAKSENTLLHETVEVRPEKSREDQADSKLRPGAVNTKRSRLWVGGMKLLVSVYETTNIIGHYNMADLCLLSDYEDFKSEFDLVNKSMASVGRPTIMEVEVEPGVTRQLRVLMRDTYLLSPQGLNSLSKIGELYSSSLDGIGKIKIDPSVYEDMEGYLDRNRSEFIAYGLQDSAIPIMHACCIEEFGFSQGVSVLPVTVSSLGSSLLRKFWLASGYTGYQASGCRTLGDVSEVITPRGMNKVGSIGYWLPHYVKSMRGGRNESFMYGTDKSTVWWDYDLEGAYTSVMAMMGNPDYQRGRSLKYHELLLLTPKEILNSYMVILCSFSFPAIVKYPSIPVTVDKETTVYPLKGSNVVISGLEYLVAIGQGCKIVTSSIYRIPFESMSKGAWDDRVAGIKRVVDRSTLVEKNQNKKKDLLSKRLDEIDRRLGILSKTQVARETVALEGQETFVREGVDLGLSKKLGVMRYIRSLRAGSSLVEMDNLLKEGSYDAYTERVVELLRGRSIFSLISMAYLSIELDGLPGLELFKDYSKKLCNSLGPGVVNKDLMDVFGYMLSDTKSSDDELVLIKSKISSLQKALGTYKGPIELSASSVLDVLPSQVPLAKYEERVAGQVETMYNVNPPFRDFISYVQGERRGHAKKSVLNLLWKLVGNGCYGLTCQGLKQSNKFDSRTGGSKRMGASDLSNPIISSWITSMIRSTIGEVMHVVEELGGRILSVTTDGFVTDLDDLENRVVKYMEDKLESWREKESAKQAGMLELRDKINKSSVSTKEGGSKISMIEDLEVRVMHAFKDFTPCYLFLEFVKIRRVLTGKDDARGLDVKDRDPGLGVYSWTTRGQLGMGGSLKAMTGFQSRGLGMAGLREQVALGFVSERKEVGFVQSSLRSSVEIYKRGGHMTAVYRDQVFRLLYDNRRRLLIPENVAKRDLVLEGSREALEIIDLSETMLDSEPLPDRGDCKVLRFITKQAKGGESYNVETTRSKGSVYKTVGDLCVRQVVRGMYGNYLGVDVGIYKGYKEFVSWYMNLDCIKPSLSESKISSIRYRGKFVANSVPRRHDTISIVEAIKKDHPGFREDLFWMK